MPTVFVVDDEQEVLSFLGNLFRGRRIPVECFNSAANYLAKVNPSRPGCLVLDLDMPEISGLMLMRHLAMRQELRPTIVTSGQLTTRTIVEVVKLGAIEVLEKPIRTQDVLDAVEVAQKTDLDRRQKKTVGQLFRQRIRDLPEGEQAVLSGLVRGLTIEQIALELDLSRRTVQIRRSRMFERLELKTKSDLHRFTHQAQWSPEADD